MNTNPQRVRLLRDGRHCHCCSQWEIRVYGDDMVKDRAHTPSYRAYRVANAPKHGRSKPKGIHVYRRMWRKVRELNPRVLLRTASG